MSVTTVMKTPLLDLGIYRVVRCGWDTVRTEFCSNGQIITPAGYSGPDREEAAIYFTERYLKQIMDENIEQILGGSDGSHSSLHDADSFHRRFPTSVKGDGKE